MLGSTLVFLFTSFFLFSYKVFNVFKCYAEQNKEKIRNAEDERKRLERELGLLDDEENEASKNKENNPNVTASTRERRAQGTVLPTSDEVIILPGEVASETEEKEESENSNIDNNVEEENESSQN